MNGRGRPTEMERSTTTFGRALLFPDDHLCFETWDNVQYAFAPPYSFWLARRDGVECGLWEATVRESTMVNWMV